MALPKLTLFPIRTSKQGQQVNIGKDEDAYLAMTTLVSFHADDLKARNIPVGSKIRIRTEHGEAEFTCAEGKVPLGMAFVPYGPPTCLLMPSDTDGTGMPTSKGWEFDVEVIA